MSPSGLELAHRGWSDVALDERSKENIDSQIKCRMQSACQLQRYAPASRPRRCTVSSFRVGDHSGREGKQMRCCPCPCQQRRSRRWWQWLCAASPLVAECIPSCSLCFCSLRPMVDSAARSPARAMLHTRPVLCCIARLHSMNAMLVAHLYTELDMTGAIL